MIESFKNGIKSASFRKDNREKITITQDTNTTWLFSVEDFGKGKVIFTHIRKGSSINLEVSYADIKYKEIPDMVLSYIGDWIIKIGEEEYHLEVTNTAFAVADIVNVARVKSGKVKELTIDDELRTTLARLSRENEALKGHIRTIEYEMKQIKKEIKKGEK